MVVSSSRTAADVVDACLSPDPDDVLPGRTYGTSPAESEVPLNARLLLLIAGAAVIAALASAFLLYPRPVPASEHHFAPVSQECAAAPSTCGFPDATNSGIPAGTVLRAVPAQVSSGRGWTSSPTGSVHVTGDGAMLSGLYIPGTLDISASHVTIRDVRVVTGGNFGISLRHTTGVIIENCVISGRDKTSGRVNYAIDDVYGDSTGTVIKASNISYFRTGAQVSTGLISRNYIHDPGYLPGDHTNGIYVNGGTRPLIISGNTIFNNRTQTDDINLDASGALGQSVANKIITGNLLAGGGYSIYGGAALRAATSNIVIKGNSFSQRYYPHGGRYGPIGYFDSRGRGNVWSGNVWSGPIRRDAGLDDPGQANVIPSP